MAVNKALTPGQAGAPALVQVKAAGELARRKIYAGIPDDDVALALAICQKYGFDPLLSRQAERAEKGKTIVQDIYGQYGRPFRRMGAAGVD